MTGEPIAEMEVDARPKRGIDDVAAGDDEEVDALGAHLLGHRSAASAAKRSPQGAERTELWRRDHQLGTEGDGGKRKNKKKAMTM
jgi:hypothetical protein